MADAGPCGKGGEVPGPHRVNIAVDPGVNLTLENVHELLLFLLGMRPRASLPGRQPHQVHANLLQSRESTDTPLMTVVFITVRILVARLRTRRGGNDEGRSFRECRHAALLTQALDTREATPRALI